MDLNTIVGTAGTAGGDVVDVEECSLAPMPVLDLPDPVVRIREEHNISRRDIDPDALKVLYRLARNNFTAYLVGGGVRDLLLGRKPKDFDISTNAKPEQIRALFRNCILIGRRFRLAHIRYGDKIIETSTFRRTPECNGDPADPETDLFQRNDNLFGTPQEDALRRDFTVNGLFYDIDSFSIIDYVGGMEDLAARRIRSIGDPCIRFREDPVRMIRAVRFASRLDFTLDPETLDAIVKHGDELSKAAPARLLEEITRLFAFSSGEKAVRLLYSTGLLAVLLPEVAACLDDDKYDSELFWGRLQALDTGDTVLPDATPALVFATLLLDPLQHKLERNWTADTFPRLKFDKIHSFLEPISQRLRFPRKLVDRIVHMYLSQHRFVHTTGSKRGSIANFVTQDSFHESLALAEILLTAEGGSQSRLGQWRDMLAERIYGREDNGQGDRNGRNGGSNAPAANNAANAANGTNGNAENAAADAPRTAAEHFEDNKKLSRSARRRRNKRLKRQRHEETERLDAVATDPETEPETASPPLPKTESAPATPPVPATLSPDAETPVEAAAAEAKPSRKERGARTRGRGGKRKQAAADTAPSGPEAERETAEPEAFKPLTAASFYAKPAEAEPEPAKKTQRKKSENAKSSGRDKPSDKEASASPDQEKAKPLPMDRAEEADTPMHWLDEI